MYLKGLCDGLTSEENVFGRQNRFDIKVVSGQGIRLSQCETIGGFNRALVIPVFFFLSLRIRSYRLPNAARIKTHKPHKL